MTLLKEICVVAVVMVVVSTIVAIGVDYVTEEALQFLYPEYKAMRAK